MRLKVLLLLLLVAASLQKGGLYLVDQQAQEIISSQTSANVKEAFYQLSTGKYEVTLTIPDANVNLINLEDPSEVHKISYDKKNNVVELDIPKGAVARIVFDEIKANKVLLCKDNNCQKTKETPIIINKKRVDLTRGTYKLVLEKKTIKKSKVRKLKNPERIIQKDTETILLSEEVGAELKLQKKVTEEDKKYVLLGEDFVSVNTKKAPYLNGPATIILNKKYQYKPIIFRDNNVCEDCVIEEYKNKLVFKVPHFTNYSASSNSQLEIYDTEDITGKTYYYEYITFTANYTNTTSGLAISGPGVYCSLNIPGESTINMSFNSGLYTHTRFFNTSKKITYTITCNGTTQGYEAITLTDSINIRNRDDRWYGASVQRNTISGTGSELTDTINAVDINKSFIVFTSRSNDDTPDDWRFTPNFSSNVLVSFNRYGTATSTISYEVVSSNGIKAQHGYRVLPTNQAEVNVSILPINPKTTFVIVHGRCNIESNQGNGGGFARAVIVNETMITLKRGRANLCEATINYQVIDWAGVSVQNQETEIPDSQDTATPTINPVNWTESFLYFSQENQGTDPGMDSNYVKGNHTGNNALLFTDEPGTTYASSRKLISYSVVSIKNATVQEIETALSSDTNIDISAVNLNRTFILTSGWNTGGGQTYRNSFFNAEFFNSSRIFYDKETNNQVHTISTYVVEVPEADPVPYFTNLSVTPANNSPYSASNHVFKANITNTNGTAGIVLNGINYTATKTGLEYEVTVPSLPAGNHTYYWWAYGQGIFNPYNQTSSFTYTIQKAQSQVSTYVNNTQSNITIERTSSIYLNGTRITGEGNISLYNNNTLINTGPGPLSNYTLFDKVGVYNISTVYEETQNYTYSIQTWYVTVIDTIAPDIINVANVSITDVSAIITWDTNEQANSTVNYGTTTALGSKKSSSSLRTSHSILLDNLNPSTTYYYNVTSCDPSGNCNTTGTYNFTTKSEPDNTPPSITGVRAELITQNSANIRWNTSEAANATVSYGETTSLGLTKSRTTFFDTHDIQLTSLNALTTYYYNVTSCDPSGNCNTTGTYNFTTTDDTAPSWSNNTANPASGVTYSANNNYYFNITWVDNIQVDTVLIEHNFTGTIQNYSVNKYQDTYHYNISDLPAGNYYYKFYANDTSNNLNITDSFTYVINKASSSTNLTLNGTVNNITIYKQENVTITAYTISPENSNITILKDGEVIASGINNITINETFNLQGIYNITALYPGNQNYSSSQTTLYVFVVNPPPSNPNDVKAENNIVYMSTTETVLDINLINTYNLSKTFLKLHFASGSGNNALPDQTSISAHFLNSTTIRLERYATGSDPAMASYSILQANNIISIPFNYSWSSAEETAVIALDKPLVEDYSEKCFIETHRNMRLNSADVSSHAEYEVQASIINQTHIQLQRDTEGSNTADPGVQYGFAVCFLDETKVQSGTFSIAGDVGSTTNINLQTVNTQESWNTISYYQADDGVGQNALAGKITAINNLRIFRDEIGSGQTAFGQYYVIDFEDQANALVQQVDYTAPGVGSALSYMTGAFTPVDKNNTFLHCENTMANGGGTAHSRSKFVFEINDSNNGVYLEEGRDRSNSQNSYVHCQVITWPNVTSYLPPSDLIVNNITFSSQYYQNEIGTINVSIQNIGVRDAENITVALNISDYNGTDYVYNQTLLVNTELLKQQETITLTYYWNASRGEKQFVVFVDSTDQNKEANESNNILTNNTYIKAPTRSVVHTHINNTRSNYTVEQYSNVLLNGTLIVGEGNITLYVNSSPVINGSSPISTIINFTTPGLYNITTEYIGNENYTNATETWFLTVVKGPPPTPLNISVDAEDVTATITWQTQRMANSSVYYGLITPDNKVSNSTMTLNHQIILTNLTANTKYYYIVESCNIFGCANSSLLSFTTIISAGSCELVYLEKGPDYRPGYISKGDLVTVKCQLPGGVKSNEEIVNIITWPEASAQKTVNTPRLLIKDERLYP